MDGVTSPTSSYRPASVPPPGNAAPTPAAVQPQPGAAACVSDFVGGVTGAFVLEWRDPGTNQVIAELPMVTAAAQIPGKSGTGTPIGQIVDTAA